MQPSLFLMAWAWMVLPSVVAAQPLDLFGSGKPPLFREEDLDLRFARSRIHDALKKPSDDRACASLAGGLLTVLAEAAPYLHQRDETFYLDPLVAQAIDAQLTLPKFPAKAVVAAMVRRVMIDGKMPRAWLETARQVPAPLLDLDKLRFLTEGPELIDSFLFTLPMLKHRHEVEVTQATSSAAESAEAEFNEQYLDRFVAWGGLTLLDVETEPGRKPGTTVTVATLQYQEPDLGVRSYADFLTLKRGPTPVRILATLRDAQYVKPHRIAKGTRILIRGRLFKIGSDFRELELRDALLFEDRDWTKGIVLAPPGTVARCPLAVNDLTGVGSKQPGGFRHP